MDGAIQPSAEQTKNVSLMSTQEDKENITPLKHRSHKSVKFNLSNAFSTTTKQHIAERKIPRLRRKRLVDLEFYEL